MSRHHEQQKWSTHTARFRVKITPLLPLPCIECGQPVMPTDKWHVGHRQAASQGGRPTLANVGPAHAGCNLRSGGKLGAQITNARRNGKRQASSGIRTGDDAW